MEWADGASFNTAETVPGVSPTCCATIFSVTTAGLGRGFLTWPIVEIVSDQFESRRKTLTCQKVFISDGESSYRNADLSLYLQMPSTFNQLFWQDKFVL